MQTEKDDKIQKELESAGKGLPLSKNEKPDFVVKIENFKPFVEINHNIVYEYEMFLKAYRRTIEANVKDKYIRNYRVHPWFGPLNPHQWLIMSAIHQSVHGRQLRKINACLSPRTGEKVEK